MQLQTRFPACGTLCQSFDTASLSCTKDHCLLSDGQPTFSLETIKNPWFVFQFICVRNYVKMSCTANYFVFFSSKCNSQCWVVTVIELWVSCIHSIYGNKDSTALKVILYLKQTVPSACLSSSRVKLSCQSLRNYNTRALQLVPKLYVQLHVECNTAHFNGPLYVPSGWATTVHEALRQNLTFEKIQLYFFFFWKFS